MPSHRHPSRVQFALLALCFLFLIANPLAAEEYGPASPEVLALSNAYVRGGILFPWTSYPVSGMKLRELADSLASTGIELPSLPLFYPVHGATEEVSSLSGYLKYNYTRISSSQQSLVQPDAPRDGIDLQRGWLALPPLAAAGFVASSDTGLSIEFDGVLRSPRPEGRLSIDNLPGFTTGVGPSIDHHILGRGILSWENPAFRVWFGRDTMQIGAPDLSTLYPSKLLPYMDAARLQGRAGPVNLDWTVSTFLPVKNWEGLDVDNAATPFERNWGGQWWSSSDFNPTTILYVAHRLEFVGDRLSFALGEQIIYARPNNSYEIKNFLPVGTFHANDTYPDNMNLIFEFGAALLPGLTLRAMAGFDDLSSDIIGIADSPVPTIPAAILGFEFSGAPVKIPLSGIIEGGYTHYLWGNFDADQNQSGNWYGNGEFLARMIARYEYDGGGVLLPLTSPYGPGALWARGLARVVLPVRDLNLEVRALFLSKNKSTNLVSTAYASDPAVEKATRTVLAEIRVALSYTIALTGASLALCAEPVVTLLDGKLGTGVCIAGSLDLSFKDTRRQ
jgi:hypothetical protein